MTGRSGPAAPGFPGDEEHGQARTRQKAAAPCDWADGLVKRELAQQERENELGNQERLHDRNLAIVQSEGLEQERSGQGHPAQEPQWIAE